MAKKTTKTEEAKVVITEETVVPEETKVEEVIKEPVHSPVVITKSETPLRKLPSLESKYIVGKMNIGVAYAISKEVNSKIYGDFYLLENGCYITKSGNYILN